MLVQPAQQPTIEVAAADDLPLADVDPMRLREVLENLLSNALRYAPAGSVVRSQRWFEEMK